MDGRMGLTHSPFVPPPPPAIDAAAEEEKEGAGPLPPSLLDPISLTRTFGTRAGGRRLRLPLAPGNEITITAASTDVRECALAGLGPRRRAGGTENAEEEGEGDGFAKIWQEIRPTKKASVRS